MENIPRAKPVAQAVSPLTQATLSQEIELWRASPSQWNGFRIYVFAAALCLPIVLVPFGILLPVIGFFLPLISGLVALLTYFSIRSVQFRLSSQRLFVTQGILTRTTTETELFRVTDCSFRQTFIERLLDLGTVAISTADRDTPYIVLGGISNALPVKEKLREAVFMARKVSGTREMMLDSR